MRAAYAGGFLLLLTGGTGAAALIRFGWALLHEGFPTLGRLLAPVFLSLLILAALGGLTVLLGGYLLQRGKRRWARFLIGLGAGAGLLGLVLHLLLISLSGGNPIQEVLSIASTLHGVGLLLAVYAQTTA